ncbi:MAG TPA: pyridoxal 5'-phosphate synthase lyase subunit PdxS, partial [Methanomicrobiales archaeon]|nr:pyridoxal 5'-phosphate synthase lyase subunit PdxS [Methanomicrobiales archaeon]
VEAVRHMRNIMGAIRCLQGKSSQELVDYARDIEAPSPLVAECAKLGRLPVVNFSAGGIATPSDAALMMQLGADGVFVGSGIFLSSNPAQMARAIVEAVNHYEEPSVIAEVSKNLGEAMRGLDVHTLKESEVLQYRGR